MRCAVPGCPKDDCESLSRRRRGLIVSIVKVWNRRTGPAVIAAGKLPDKAPVVTSAANPHYQKRFDLARSDPRSGRIDRQAAAPQRRSREHRRGAREQMEAGRRLAGLGFSMLW
jgi:hypothetical protein